MKKTILALLIILLPVMGARAFEPLGCTLNGKDVIVSPLIIGGMHVYGTATHEGPIIIDADADEVFLIRKDGDAGDLAVFDTNNFDIEFNPTDFTVKLPIDITGDYFVVTSVAGAELTDNAGEQVFFLLDPEINQTGTASYSLLKGTVAETGVGTGVNYLLHFSVDGVEKLSVTNLGALKLVPIRSASAYSYALEASDGTGTEFFTGGADEKQYGFNMELRRPLASAASGDSRDGGFHFVYRNYSTSANTHPALGFWSSMRNEAGGVLGYMKAAEFGVNNKGTATAETLYGFTSTVENYGTINGAIYGGYFDLRNENTVTGDQVGVYIVNTDNSTALKADAAVKIFDAGTNTGWVYGLDMSGATITDEFRGQNDETIDNATDGFWDFGGATLMGVGGLLTGDIEISSANPKIDFKDTDGTDADVNASIDVQLTDTGSGTEDADVTMKQQVAGVPTTFLSSDADGVFILAMLGQTVHMLQAAGKVQMNSAANNFINIRPNSGEIGYLTFTEDSVADRWSIGIEDADTNLYLRPGDIGVAPVLTLSAAGLATLAAGLTLAGDITDYEAVNDGSPEFRLGSADAEELHIQSVYDAGAQTLDYVKFYTDVASAVADKGKYVFDVDGTTILSIDDGGIEGAKDRAFTLTIPTATAAGSGMVIAADAAGSGVSAGGILTLRGGAGFGGGVDGYVRISDGTDTPTQVLDDDSLYVAGKFEATGASYFGVLNVQTYMQVNAAAYIQFGIGTLGEIRPVTDDGLHFSLYGSVADQGNRNLIITDYDSRTKDHDHDTASVNPTVIIHSVTDPDVSNNQWGSISHNQANFVLATGANTGVGTGATTINNGVLFSLSTLTTGAAAGYGLNITRTLNDAAASGGDFTGLNMVITETDLTGFAGGVWLMKLATATGVKFSVDDAGNIDAAGGYTLDDGAADSPILTLKDADDKTLTLQKLDAGGADIINDEGAVNIKASADTNDYLGISVAGNDVFISAVAGDSGNLHIAAGGGAITMDDDVHIGADDAGESLAIHDGAAITFYDASDDTSVSLSVGDGTTILNLTGSLDVSSTVYAAIFDTDVAAAGLTVSGTTIQMDGTDLTIPLTVDVKGSDGTGYVEIIDDDNGGALAVGRTTNTSGHGSTVSVVDGGADNAPGWLDLFDDGGTGNYFWVNTARVFRAATAKPADDDAGGYAIMDLSNGTIGALTQNINGATVAVATALNVTALTGLKVGAGADADMTLLTADRNAADATLIWNDVDDQFEMNNPLVVTGEVYSSAFDASDGNITNVGAINADSINADGTTVDYNDVNILELTQEDVGATCTAGQIRFDTGGATKEICFCEALNTWACTATTAGPTD